MKNKIKLIVLSFLCFIALTILANTSNQDFIIVFPEFVSGVQADTPLSEQTLAREKIASKCRDNPQCVSHFLATEGANKQAIAFAAVWGAVITETKNYGNIYAIRAWLPSSTREGIYLGNEKGQIFEIENWLDNHAYIKRYYPNNDTRLGCQFPLKQIKADKNTQRLICIYPVVDQQNKINAYADMAFDFDNQGNFIKSRFLKIQGVKNEPSTGNTQ